MFVGKPPSTDDTDNHTTFCRKSPVRAMHNDLDEALAKLQQILANNFTLDGKFRSTFLILRFEWHNTI